MPQSNLKGSWGKYGQLITLLESAEKPVVAFSGGVDSTLLLHAAVEAWGDKALGYFASSNVLKSGEKENVVNVSRQLGARLKIHEISPLDWPEFVANPPERCYLCKKKIYSFFISCLNMENDSCLMDGTNADDLQTDRPGLSAISELGIATPLATVGLTKAEIRQLSKSMGLTVWDRPSSSCLATRIPAGVPVSLERLILVDRGESLLHELGFLGCRLKLQSMPNVVRLQLVNGDIEKICVPGIRKKVVKCLETLGFDEFLLDLSERESILF